MKKILLGFVVIGLITFVRCSKDDDTEKVVSNPTSSDEKIVQTSQGRLDNGEEPIDIFQTGFPVDSLLGKTYKGGLIAYLDTLDGKGLITTPIDQGEFEWQIAKNTCVNLILGGYDDWYLPSKEELDKLYLSKGLTGGFTVGRYWSSSENTTNDAWGQYFSDGKQNLYNKYVPNYVRAVRAF
tara:strand:+ start:31 stop:576 length:546 start_codon:yes stop_codon:yes gene_type:complete